MAEINYFTKDIAHKYGITKEGKFSKLSEITVWNAEIRTCLQIMNQLLNMQIKRDHNCYLSKYGEGIPYHPDMPFPQPFRIYATQYEDARVHDEALYLEF